MKHFVNIEELDELKYRKDGQVITVKPKESRTYSASVTVELPDTDDTAHELVSKDAEQTLTNKTLTSPKVNSTAATTATSEDLNKTANLPADTQAEIDAKADEAREIATGDGLTGGGDLSADRTIDLTLDGTTLSKSPTGLKVETITNDEITDNTINRDKLVAGTASEVVVHDGAGNLVSEPTLAKVRGGTGQDNTNLTFPASGRLADLDADLVDMNGNGALKVPVGNDGQRPGTPAVGQIRFNTALGFFEGFDGTEWDSIGLGGALTTESVVGSGNTVNAVEDTHYLADVRTGTLTVQLPAGSEGATIKISDVYFSAGNNSIFVQPATGEALENLAINEVLELDIDNAWIELSWNGMVWNYNLPAVIGDDELLGADNTFTGSNTFTQPINGSISGNSATTSDATVVRTSGDQVITGVKTFSDDVGIGTVGSLAAYTDLNDSIENRQTIRFSDQTITVGSYFNAGVSQHSYIQSSNGAGTGNTNLAINPKGGNVGIGTRNASSALDVRNTGTGNDVLRLTSDQANPSTNLIQATGFTGTVFAMKSNGDVGIGTATPSTVLEVVGTRNDANEGVANFLNTSTLDAAPVARFQGNSTGTGSANKYVNFTRQGSQNGAIVGNGAGAVTFGAYSDQRLKENIVALSGELAKINALNPVSFDFKDGSGSQTGFLAQELQTVYPDSVSVDESTEEKYLQIGGWSRTEARLVAAIKELSAKLDEAETRIQTLEGN